MGKWADAIEAIRNAHPKGKPLKKDGSELPDPVPMDPPIGYNPQPSMFEVIRKMIKDEKLRQSLDEEGIETPEEADDFDVDDDYDPSSPYEHNFDPPAPPDVREQVERRVGDVRVAETPSPESSSPDSHSSGEGGAAGGGSQKRPPADPPSAKVKK